MSFLPTYNMELGRMGWWTKDMVGTQKLREISTYARGYPDLTNYKGQVYTLTEQAFRRKYSVDGKVSGKKEEDNLYLTTTT